MLRLFENFNSKQLDSNLQSQAKAHALQFLVSAMLLFVHVFLFVFRDFTQFIFFGFTTVYGSASAPCCACLGVRRGERVGCAVSSFSVCGAEQILPLSPVSPSFSLFFPCLFDVGVSVWLSLIHRPRSCLSKWVQVLDLRSAHRFRLFCCHFLSLSLCRYFPCLVEPNLHS